MSDTRLRPDRDTLIGYVRDTARSVPGADVEPAALPAHIRLARRVLPPQLAVHARLLATNAIAPFIAGRINELQQWSPLRLHLGSGKFPRSGWVNVDLLGVPVNLPYDLRRRLPFRDGSVDAVFHEHLLEHLPLDAGLRLTEETWRVLKPGGVLRIGVPDAGAYLQSYAWGGGFITTNRPDRPTQLLALQELFYEHGHETMFDLETLALVCRAAGFEEVERRESGSSRITPCPDAPHRASETLYVEAVKLDPAAGRPNGEWPGTTRTAERIREPSRGRPVPL